MYKQYFKILSVILLSIGFNLAGLAQHVVDLTGNVPSYGQESCCWCGAASGQMIMDGYPNPVNRLFHPQVDIWNTIQANNSTNPADAILNWCTDPQGLRNTLLSMNPPTAGTWIIHADASRNAVEFDILYWMNRNNFPVATLINQGGHWVVIVGYETDIEPVSGSNPTLQEITKYDPEPHNVGSQSTMTAAIWHATDYNGSIVYAGTWHNQYVAVIEPPVERGKVNVETVIRTGEKVISPEEAIRYVQRWIKEMEISSKPSYAILQKDGVSHLQPILVREEITPKFEKDQDYKKEERIIYYYIVPFGFEEEIGDCGIRLARVCIIINAYSGQFEEVAKFGKPVRYLPEREVRNIVAKTLRLRKDEMKDFKTEMMFQPSDISHIRIYPFWKVLVGKHVLYVDQLGKVYGKISPSIPGD